MNSVGDERADHETDPVEEAFGRCVADRDCSSDAHDPAFGQEVESVLDERPQAEAIDRVTAGKRPFVNTKTPPPTLLERIRGVDRQTLRHSIRRSSDVSV